MPPINRKLKQGTKAILTQTVIPWDRTIREVKKLNNGRPIRTLPYDYQNWLSIKVLNRIRQNQILRMYASGKTPEEISYELQMRLNYVANDINRAIDRMIAEYATPTPEVTFVRYAAFQFSVIDQLQQTVEDFRKDSRNTQYSALVSALKSQSDIYDKVIDKGQSLNVITRKHATKNIRATSQDLRATVKRELITLQRLSQEIEHNITDSSSPIPNQTPTDPTTGQFQRKSIHARKQLKEQSYPKTNLKANPTIDPEPKIAYVAKIRRVLRDKQGIVQTTLPWFYRDTPAVYHPDGSYKNKQQQTESDIQKLESSIPALRKKEKTKATELRRKFYESRGIAYIETQDGELIPFDPTKESSSPK